MRTLHKRQGMLLSIGVVVMMLLGGEGVALMQTSDPTPTPSVGRRANTNPDAQMVEPAEGCELGWFFAEPIPESCPANEPVSSEAAFQRFEYGFMIWTQMTDNIYAVHHTEGEPRWMSAPDPYVEGEPERDFSFDEPQPPQSTQPRLGFGALWRQDDDLRARIGWAVQAWETVYTAQMQIAEDGTIYLEEPGGGILELMPDASDWKLYRSS